VSPLPILRFKIEREHLIVIGFSLLNAIGGLATNRVLTQLVAPDPLGVLYLYMNLAMWVTLPAAGAYSYLQRHWAVAREHSYTRRYARGVRTGIILLALFAAIAVLAMIPFPRLQIRSPRVVLSLWLVCVGVGGAQLLEWLASMERRRVIAGIVMFLGTPMRQLALAIGGWFLVTQTGAGLLGVQAAYSIGLAMALGTIFAILVRRVPEPKEGNPPVSTGLTLRGLVGFATPYFLSAMLAQACRSAERWGLADYSTVDTALFVQALGLSTAIVTTAIGHLFIYYSPIIYQASAKTSAPLSSARQPIRHYVRWTVVILSLVVLSIALLAKWVTPLLFGPKYQGVVALLPWTTLGAALFGLGQTLHIYGLTARRTIGSNAAVIVAQLLYTITLVSYRPPTNPALAFARIYAVGNLVYVVAMLISVVVVVRSAKSTETAVTSAPPEPDQRAAQQGASAP
jgi:O-antigen/teichoic acid export membrane protein